MELILDHLQVVWFVLVTVLFIGFFILEGFDYGVAMLVPFIGKSDMERRQMVNAIGPFWDGNQVWLLTAGGATFASFPHVYATMFSGFYVALFLMLVALIARGISFEFRSKDKSPTWRTGFDWAMCLGSFFPSLLWGVAVGNLIQGVPIDQTMTFQGNFFTLLSPYTVLCGIAFVLVFAYHGALFTSIRVTGDLSERARATALVLGVVTAVGALVLGWANSFFTDMYANNIYSLCAYGTAVVLFIISWVSARVRKVGLAFAFSCLTIASITIAYFAGLFPRLMVSSLNPEWSLTIYNASSSQYTLTLMTIVAAIMVPVVLLYQIWSFYTFRKPVSPKDLTY